VLPTYRFSVGEYNKLAMRKIGPLEVVGKINSNTYRLKLSSQLERVMFSMSSIWFLSMVILKIM
jgi:hypothetical protein